MKKMVGGGGLQKEPTSHVVSLSLALVCPH